MRKPSSEINEISCNSRKKIKYTWFHVYQTCTVFDSHFIAFAVEHQRSLLQFAF